MILKSKRIMIVEDNTLNRVTYQMALMGSGANISFDRWGEKVIGELEARKYDLVILDLMLGIASTKDGYSLFKDIKALPNMQQTPIIAISASDPSQAMSMCRELGFDGYIAKPINEIEFSQQLLDIIDGQSVWLA